MMSPLTRGGLIVACCLFAHLALATPDEHLNAVAMARQGDTASAIETLQALYQQQPSQALVYDLIAIAHWHPDDALALHWAEQLYSTDTLPDYTLHALARSYRNLGYFEQALTSYRQCRVRWPDDRDCQLGEALVLAEQGQSAEALAAINAMLAAEPKAADLYGYRGYIYRVSRMWLQAADDYRRAAELAPGDTQYRHLQIVSLLDLGAVVQAQHLARDYPASVDVALKARLKGDLAARHINWIDLPNREPALRQARIDRARLSLNEARDVTLDPDRQAFDYLLLADRERRPETVLTLAKQMREAGIVLPEYVLSVIAGAHLQLRQPEQALDIIDTMSAEAAQDFNVQVMRIYALEESGQYTEAVEVADALMAREPLWRYFPGLLEPQRNNARFRAERLAAMMRAYGNRLHKAEQRLDPLVDGAPLSAAARADRAAVYHWRGWSQKALREYQIILSHDPEHTDAHLGLAYLNAERGLFTEAEQHWQALQPLADTQRIQRARQRFDRQHGWALDQRFGTTESTGDTQGEREFRSSTELTSPVFGEGWRAYLGSDYQRADFPEGRGRERVDRAGIRRRQPHFDWYAGIHRAHFNANGDGLHGGVRWLPNDHYYLGLALAQHSPDTPLRGRNQDVGADRAELSAGWRASESLRVDASINAWDFTDGNVRQSLQASLAQRLFVDHLWQLDGRVDVWASRNREGDYAYFNPSEDASATLGLDIHHRVFRRYDHQFRHRLQLGGGVYYQEGYGSDWIGNIAWRPRWDLNPAFAIEAGIALQSRVYDGQREEHLGFNLDFNWRWR